VKKIFNLKKYLLPLAFVCCVSSGIKAQVLLNEYSCANLSNYLDNYAKYEDWLELYNAGSTNTDISGYFLSDDSLQLNKFPIPAGTTLNAGSHLVIWCSGRNSGTGANIHASFKLTQTKNKAETIYLSNPGSVILDKIKIKKTKLGHSRGRISDGNATWGIFTAPSANASNTGTSYTAYADRPSMDILPGFYTSAVTVSITNNEPTSNAIYYTLDGTEPTVSSTLYSGPITISTTRVLKAIAISTVSTILPSFIEFNTYFINEVHTLPVVSIAGTDLQTLANGSQALRPHGSIEYFSKTGVRTSSSYGEYNSHGQDSWVNDQRSLDFVARDEMGYSKELKEKVFALTDRDKFQRLILRAAGDDNYPANHAPDNKGSAHLRDAFFQNLCKQGGMKLDTRTAAKCIVYINGGYWGVYDLREIPDEHDYTEYYYGQDKYNLQYILTWGNTWAEYGGSSATTAWNILKSYVFNNSMADSAKFAYVESQLDVQSLADYVIAHSLSVSSDWLNYNTGWWRGMNPAGEHKKWGYILWDNDASFAFYINYTYIPDTSATAKVCNVDNLYQNPWSDPQQHTRVLKRLRDNAKFNQWYISRYADLMNTTFSCENMLRQLDSSANLIAPEMTRHAARWSGTYTEWWKNYNQLRFFISRRCGATANTGMNPCYNLTGPYPVTFTTNPQGAANITVNSLTVNALPWNANYFGNIDILLNTTTYSATTYDFQKWTSMHHTFLENDTLNLNKFRITQSDTVVALYKTMSAPPTPTLPPVAYDTYANVFPNPSQDVLSVYFTLAEKLAVTIKLYSVTGQYLGEYLPSNSELEAGAYTMKINTLEAGLSSGMYVIRFSAGDYNRTFKVVHQKP